VTQNKLSSLPDIERHELVYASIGFLRTVTHIYGPDRGMEIWAQLADAVDADLKAQVFMAMLSGDMDQRKIMVRTSGYGDFQKVSFIRSIRTYDRRNLDLKQAKEIADDLIEKGHVMLEVDTSLKPTFKVELRKLGLLV